MDQGTMTTTTATHYWKVAKATDRQGVFRSVAGSPQQEYEIGKTYTLENEVKPELCRRGFHACQDARMLRLHLRDYGYDREDVLLEVLLGGRLVVTDGVKSVASEITILGVACWEDAIAEASGTPYVNPSTQTTFTFNEKGLLLCITTVAGDESWYFEGKYRHRDGDQPAVVHANGILEWWVYGVRHRGNDKPAVQYPNGDMEWWVHGDRHRDDGRPAVEWANGTRAWWDHGKLHRDDNKPAIQHADGTLEWWCHGKKDQQAL